MKTGKLLASGLIAAVAVAVALVFASPGSAQAPTISAGSLGMDVGAQGTVDVQALDIAAPGLGAWTIDVTYDPAVVSVLSCTSTVMICNHLVPNAPNTVRVVGFAAGGLVGDTTLATIAIQCGASAGSSPLSVTVVDFLDATLGAPAPITATVVNGSVTCSVPTPVLMADVRSMDVGAQSTITVAALGIPAPGLGSWTVDVTYDPAVIEMVAGSCIAITGTCDETFAPGTVRVAGSDVAGKVGDITLATMSVRCNSAGSSPLGLTAVEFLDATPGAPAPITPLFMDGSVTCTALPAAPSDSGAAAPVLAEEAAPAVALPSGGGLPPASGDDAFPWAYLLIGAGALALLGSGALALRARQQR